MALSKSWTVKNAIDILRGLVNKLAPDEDLRDEQIVNYLNIAIQKVAVLLNNVQAPDYGTTAILTNSNNYVNTSAVAATSYDDSERGITKTSHGLDTSNVGQRIIIFYVNTAVPEVTMAAISTIASIVDSNHFKIADSLGADYTTSDPNYLYYSVFSPITATQLDVSNLRIDRIIKIVDSANGLVRPLGVLEFEDVENAPQRQSNVYYNHFGETLYIYKGSSVSALGTLTLYYYRYPLLASVDNQDEYLDIKDKYVSLVLAEAKQLIYEQLNMQAPESLSNLIQAETNGIIGIKDKTDQEVERSK